MIDYSQIPSPCYVLESEKLIENLELIDSVQKKAGITIILALNGKGTEHRKPLQGKN
ncbi:MAG: carboxynorspermidine decarboxylase, partial [Moorea sp. SIO3E2]|nr:carboxynorspermidine decarboxylase [Moorena sp. SIO3E2]